MNKRAWATILFVAFVLVPCGATRSARGATPQAASYNPQFGDGVLDAVVTILVGADGEAQPVGSGLVVRGDGLVLTPYHLVKGAREIKVRLRNGEMFDRADLIATDERRDVAILRIPAVGLYSVTGVSFEEGWVGSPVALVSNVTGAMGEAPTGVLNSVMLGEGIPGACPNCRVLKFTAPVAPNAIGGVLVDNHGRALGLVTTLPQAQGQAYAVPLSTVVGLVRSVGVQPSPVAPLQTQVATRPFPIPQQDVSVPQRPVTPLAARGPGSVVVKPSRPVDVLLASKTIYVTTRTTFFKPEQLINELKKRAELDAWGLSFVDDEQVADLVLTIDHVVFTWKFTFTLTHQRTGVVVATGSRIIWDGNLGAPYMAERVVEKLTQVRAQVPTKQPPTDVKNEKKDEQGTNKQ
jgi:S1-C subfamily serine protease